MESAQRPQQSHEAQENRRTKQAALIKVRQELQAQERDKRAAERKVKEQAERAEQEAQWAQEAAVTVQRAVSGSTLITCGAGIEFQHIISGFEISRITIRNLPECARPHEVEAIFTQQGIEAGAISVVSIKPTGNRKMEATVLTKNHDAQIITIGLDGIRFRDNILEFEIGENVPLGGMDSSRTQADTLTVSWRPPSITMIAVYLTIEDARMRVAALNNCLFHGRHIRVEMNTSPLNAAALRFFKSESIKIMGIPPHVSQGEVLELSGAITVRPVKSNNYNMQTCIDDLRQYLECLPGACREFNVTMPTATTDIVAKVQFRSWEDAKAAHDCLKQTRLSPNYPPFRLFLPKGLKYSMFIPEQQYRAQKSQWDSLSESGKQSTAFVKITPRSHQSKVYIDVLGDDKKAVGSLKVRVEGLAAGKRLDSDCWNRWFFSLAGRTFITQVMASTHAYVRIDTKIRALRIYGDKQFIDEALEMIKLEVERLEFEEWSICLSRQSVRFFIQKGLSELQGALGKENATLDLTSSPCRLTVRGGEEARLHVGRLCEEAARNPNAVNGNMETDEEDAAKMCPICYDEITHPVHLQCEHTYCRECLHHYLKSAAETKNFPLTCLGNDATCRVPLSIPLIQRFLSLPDFNQLVDVAFLTYLEKNPKDFAYCTTPDCNEVFRCGGEKTVVQCPSCFTTICSACREESHDGMTCDERRIQSNPAEQDRLNEEWASANGVKKCTRCQVLIEKTAGCNHMECKCGAHICWTCMEVFEATTIYDHMRAAHGGIYDNAPGVANQGIVDGVAIQFNDPHILREQEQMLQRLRLARAEQHQAPPRPLPNHDQLQNAIRTLQEREDVMRARREVQQQEEERIRREAERPRPSRCIVM